MQGVVALACNVMAAKAQRGRTVPCPPWWIDKAKTAMGKMTNRALAARVGSSEFKISRLLSGQVTTLELIDEVSRELGIPNPFAVAQTEEQALSVGVPQAKPVATDTAEEIIRKNLIRAREQAGFDQLSAADATGMPFETLRAYELGEVEVPNSALRTIAPVYGRKPGDFFELEMPAVDFDGAKRVFFRGRPEDIQLLTPDELARAASLEREYEERIRERKKAQLDHFKRTTKERKGKR